MNKFFAAIKANKDVIVTVAITTVVGTAISLATSKALEAGIDAITSKTSADDN